MRARRIAVIGSGISGLAAAYYLSRKHEVSLFEKDSRLGGHTHTHMIDAAGRKFPVDTGFIVHNERTYPNLVKLFREIGVDTAPSDMSFASFDPATGFEWSSRGLNGFFAQRSNLASLRHYLLLKEILRFNQRAPQLLEREGAEDLTLGDFLKDGKYAEVFVERYLVPMTAAIWSMSPEAMLKFPAVTMVRFMANHGMLGIHSHPQWKTVKGGCSQYISKLVEPFKNRIAVSVEIRSVKRGDLGVMIEFARHPSLYFDEAVFACPCDQVLPMLKDATEPEREVLKSFTTTRNEAVLHTDARMLPSRAAARASWNYRIGENSKATLTYHMNRLQPLPTKDDYCVTLNATSLIDPDKIVRKMVYHHPLYTREMIRAQDRWKEISGVRRIHFAGAYWFYGFHEDGLNSAQRVARAMGVEC
ncbi:MAG: FAD-dependent oxidoreductase [Bryobacteraceae bacterium]|nr:FAD-dependent oxidoreductase [Bryobacteraceae bacterium]